MIIGFIQLTGDLLSWEEEDRWTLRSPLNISKEEVYEFERDVCKSTESSLALVPLKMPFFDGSHVCSKLSGSLVEYVEKDKFQRITHFLTGRGQTSSNECGSTWNTEDRAVQVFLGATDREEEGSFRTLKMEKDILHLPWAPNRPTKNGTTNNCIMLTVRSKEVGRPMLNLEEGQTDLIDENCISKV